MLAIKKVLQFGNHTLTLETGVIARQATSAVMVDLDGTTVLVSVVGKPPAEGEYKDFFPLTVNYQERSYASGKIPGGFFKREGRPSERETLISRLIDRPIRPLFPKGFNSEVQVIATVLSLNPEVESDIPAMIGASAALALSGMPFQGPIGAARVGYVNGEYVLNPTQTVLKESKLDLVVAGTESAVLMVESEAAELPEDVMLDAVMYGHQQFQPIIQAIQEIQKTVAAGKQWPWQAPVEDIELRASIENDFGSRLAEAYKVRDKLERQDQIKVLRQEALAALATATEAQPEPQFIDREVIEAFEALEKRIVRGSILRGEARIDGRDTKTVRPISIRTGILERTHGSALFTRGETQALVTVTLGTTRDMQMIDGPFGEQRESFMLHYNFPPYCVGEVGMVGSPKRREIGHGRLAKRGVQEVLPTMDEFPYVLRVVSEITESNGSSSMASVCGSSLALMDAGVPLKAPVAGIAMGLIKEDNDYAVVSDILGDEDHLGDMDFKVAGTDEGVTALQMDIKIQGITKEIMQKALAQAKEGRLHILKIMKEAIAKPRQDLSNYAPRIIAFSINPEKIKDVIGKGGATIRQLTEEFDVTIDIQDDGTIQIASTDSPNALAVQKKIEMLTADIELGKIYEGRVVRLADFGAFVNLLPGKDGLLHISQIAHHRVQNVSDELSEGQIVRVKVTEIDRQGRVKLSMKELLEEEKAQS